MHLKSDTIKIIINDTGDEVIEEIFQSLLSRYQTRLETPMTGKDFILNCVHLLYYKCHKINFKRGGSYIDFPDWIKKHAVKVALNHKEIKKGLERITKTKPFIGKHNWEGMHYPSERNDWKKFEKNNLTIALNALYSKKDPAYVSKDNSNREQQALFKDSEWRRMALSYSKKNYQHR